MMDALTTRSASEDYAEALGIRDAALERRLLFVPGFDPTMG